MASQSDVIDVEPEAIPSANVRTDLAIRPEFAGIETLEQMQRRQEVLEILLQNALRKTSNRHWLNYGEAKNGKPTDPRPEDEAAVLIARDLGISYVWVPMGDGPEDWLERKKANGASEIIVKIRGHCFGQIIEELGSASTDDALLKHSKRADERGRVALFTDVLKKARANGIVRLVQAFGVRAVTWDDLAKAGIKREDCDKVTFAESEESAAKGAAQEAVGKACPKCGKPMRLRGGSKGKFLGCAGYPECKHTENVPEATADAAPAEPAPAPEATPQEPAAPSSDESLTIEALYKSLEKRLPKPAERLAFARGWCDGHSVSPAPRNLDQIKALGVDALNGMLDALKLQEA